jgi:hypothetical protein
VAHACNPSYSGGRDQENFGSKPARENSFKRPYLEKPFTKIGLMEWLKVKALSSSPSTTRKKKSTHYKKGLAHSYNPCYLRGRDQEDHSLKPAPGKWFKRSYLGKIPNPKQNWRSGFSG